LSYMVNYSHSLTHKHGQYLCNHQVVKG